MKEKAEPSFFSFHSPNLHARPQGWSGSRNSVCLFSGFEEELINRERENPKSKKDVNCNSKNKKAVFEFNLVLQPKIVFYLSL